MKIKDVPVFKQKVLEMLPVTQADVWKNLGIGHRDGSALIGIMIKEHLITKRKIDNTFMLEKKNGSGQEKKKDYSALINRSGNFSVCCNCQKLNCDAKTCKELAVWLFE